MHLSPYVVFRRTRLAYSQLQSSSFDALWQQVQEMVDKHAQLEVQTSRLTAHLESVISVTAPRDRSRLITLKRDVHNMRVEKVKQRLLHCQGCTASNIMEPVSSWIDTCRSYEILERRLSQVYADSRDEVSRHYRSLYQADAIEPSIQLSGGQLHSDLTRLISHGSRIKPTKERTLETTLVNYLYRAATKPSPFGRFVEVGAFDPSQPNSEPRRCSESSVTTNRILTSWLTAVTARSFAAPEMLAILNSTLRVKRDIIQFIGIPPGECRGAPSIPEERLLTIRKREDMMSVLKLLMGGPRSVGDLIIALNDQGIDESHATNLLSSLSTAGIIFFRLPVDDHDVHYVQTACTALRLTKDESLRAAFQSLANAEKEFPTASVATRHDLLLSIKDSVNTVASAHDVPAPPDSVLKSPLYEDLPATAAPQTWDSNTVERSARALRSIWLLSDLMDSSQRRQLGLSQFIADMNNGAPVTFLDFFDSFSRLSIRERQGILRGENSPQIARFAQQYSEALLKIRDAVNYTQDEAHLESQVILDAITNIDDFRPTKSVTIRGQFTTSLTSHISQLIINGVMTGYGTYMSRFATFVNPSGTWSLVDGIRRHLSDHFPGQCDLNSVLGFNFNVHPQMTAHSIAYPGVVPVLNGAKTHSIQDLILIPTAEAGPRRVAIFDRAENELIDLQPMNFMVPFGVPLLYRTLEFLCPSTRYLWNPAQDLLDIPMIENSCPRIYFDDVVAQRRSWTCSAETLPCPPEKLFRGDLAALQAFDSWRLSARVPRHVFALVQTATERQIFSGAADAPTLLSEYKHLRRASVHKPIYLDLRNPLLVRSLAKVIMSRPELYVTFSEFLPSEADYTQNGSCPSYAEEYFIELCAE